MGSPQISGEHYSRHIWREIQSVILALIDSKDGLNTTIFHSGLLHRGVLFSGEGRSKGGLSSREERSIWGLFRREGRRKGVLFRR